jgi:asparagine synthase (glutamine-hydrolysing)
MPTVFAGIFEDAPRVATRPADAVRRALALEEGEAAVRELGPLTLGWTGPGAHESAEVTCVVDGRMDPLDVAGAYRLHGDDAPRELRDDFSLVAWDSSRRRGLLARDPLGIGALFFARTGAVLAFATEVRTLLRLLPSRPAPDALAVTHWLARGSEAPGRTFYDGISRLEPGSRLPLEAGARSERYWTPRFSRPESLTPSDAAERLRSAVESSVVRAAGAGARPGVLLSGGFDSGYVASLAARAGLAPRAFSAVFPDQPTVDESRFIDSIAAALRLQGSRLSVRPGNPFPAALEYVSRWELPLPSLGHFYTRALLRRAAAENVDILLDGEGGDEAFGFDGYLIADVLGRGRLAKAISLSAALAGPGDALARRTLRVLREYGLRGRLPYGPHSAARRRRDPRRNTPRWLSDQSARLLVDGEDPWSWKLGDGPRWWAHRMHVLTTGADTLGVGDYLRRRARAVDVEVAHPLMSLDVVELVLALPPDLALGGADDRALARRSAEGVMPEAALRRTGKTYFNELHNNSLAGQLEYLHELLLGAGAQIGAYVRPDAVRAALLERVPPPAARALSGWAPQMWRLASMETWLRAQEDSSYLERALDALEPRTTAPELAQTR